MTLRGNFYAMKILKKTPLILSIFFFFYKFIFAFDLRFEHQLEWLYGICEVASIAIIVASIEPYMHSFALKLNRFDTNWVLESATKMQNIFSIIISALVAALISIALISNNILIILFCSLLAIIIWLYYLIIVIQIEYITTAVSYPIPVLYLSTAIACIIVSTVFEDVIFTINYTNYIMNKEVIFRFAESFMVVGASVVIGNRHNTP